MGSELDKTSIHYPLDSLNLMTLVLLLKIWLIDKFYILSIIGVKYGKWSFKIKFRWGWWISDEKI